MTFLIIKSYHVPESPQKTTVLYDGEAYLRYSTTRHKKTTELYIEYTDGLIEPVNLTVAAYTWPEQSRIPECLEPRLVEWLVNNMPRDAVMSALVRVTENRITTIARTVQYYKMYALDTINTREDPAAALRALYTVTLDYYSMTVDLIKYSYLKKTGMFPELTQKYSFLEKYLGLLSDDLTTLALATKEPKEKPEEWYSEEDVEDWLTSLV